MYHVMMHILYTITSSIGLREYKMMRLLLLMIYGCAFLLIVSVIIFVISPLLYCSGNSACMYSVSQ